MTVRARGGRGGGDRVLAQAGELAPVLHQQREVVGVGEQPAGELGGRVASSRLSSRSSSWPARQRAPLHEPRVVALQQPGQLAVEAQLVAAVVERRDATKTAMSQIASACAASSGERAPRSPGSRARVGRRGVEEHRRRALEQLSRALERHERVLERRRSGVGDDRLHLPTLRRQARLDRRPIVLDGDPVIRGSPYGRSLRAGNGFTRARALRAKSATWVGGGSARLGLLARAPPVSTSAESIPARRAPATSISRRSPTARMRPGPRRSRAASYIGRLGLADDGSACGRLAVSTPASTAPVPGHGPSGIGKVASRVAPISSAPRRTAWVAIAQLVEVEARRGRRRRRRPRAWRTACR